MISTSTLHVETDSLLIIEKSSIDTVKVRPQIIILKYMLKMWWGTRIDVGCLLESRRSRYLSDTQIIGTRVRVTCQVLWDDFLRVLVRDNVHQVRSPAEFNHALDQTKHPCFLAKIPDFVHLLSQRIAQSNMESV